MRILFGTVALLYVGSAAANTLLNAISFYDAGRFTAAFEIFEELGLNGDARAQAWTGYLYERGEGVERDYAEAVQWYVAGAERNDPVAQYRLGFFYERGRGIEQDYTLVLDWYQRAAEQGDPNAQYGLARMYRDGLGVEANFEVGRNWYMLAAEQGLRGPLQAHYAPDPGSPVSDGMVQFLERAAEEGDVNAAVRLGHIFRTGNGVDTDAEVARQWFLQAALADHAHAQASLAFMLQQDTSPGRTWNRPFSGTKRLPSWATRWR